MLAAINTKLLLAILAVVVAIGSVIAYDHNETVKAANILKQQQQEAQRQRQQAEDYAKKVSEEQRKHNTNPANGSKTWTSYLP